MNNSNKFMTHFTKRIFWMVVIVTLASSPFSNAKAIFIEQQFQPCEFTPPNTPGSLTASPDGDVYINWTDTSTDEDGFILERSNDQFTTVQATMQFPADTSSAVDSGLADGTYVYRVYAFNATGGYSGYASSQEVIIEASPSPSPSESPVAVLIDAINLEIALPSCATITIVKNSINGNDAFDFEMTRQDSGNPSKDFTLVTSSESTWASESFSVYANADGTIYSLTEGELAEGWSLTGSLCAYDFVEKRLPIESSESILVYPGDQITCTFENTYVAPTPTPTPILINGGGPAPVAPQVTPTPSTSPVPSFTPQILGISTAVGDPANLIKYRVEEGDLIRAVGDHHVYILNSAGYKRLYLNPLIFGFYGEASWDRIKIVDPEVRDAFPTSALFRNCETQEPKVYGAEITGEDTGMLHWLNISSVEALEQDGHFFKKVFCINTAELTWFLNQ